MNKNDSPLTYYSPDKTIPACHSDKKNKKHSPQKPQIPTDAASVRLLTASILYTNISIVLDMHDISKMNLEVDFNVDHLTIIGVGVEFMSGDLNCR